MVRNQHHSLRKVELQPAVLGLLQLPTHTLVPADSYLHGGPPVGHGHGHYTKMLLRHGHPGVEEISAVKVQGCAYALRDSDTAAGY